MLGDVDLVAAGAGLPPDVLQSVTDVLDELGSSSEEGRAFHPRLPFEVRGSLRERLLSAGFADADVVVQRTIEPDRARVDLAITLEPGPRTTVGEIRVTGRERTRSSFVASRITLEEGERWTVEKERASLNRLYATGLFRRVSLELDPAAEGEARRDLLVDLEELPSREVWVEPGYGSYEQARLRVGARERNLFGTGRQLSAEGTVAVKATRARIGLADPWFLRTELVGDLRYTFQERENPSFTERENGIGAFVTHNWSGRSSTTFGYQYRRSDITDFEEINGEVAEALQDVDLSSLRLSQRFDSRLPFFLPSSGQFAEAALEWGDSSLGSELDFLRATLTLSAYATLRESTVLASSLRIGAIQPLGGDDVIPVQERFFGGGENSVRSYREDELGPKDADGDPVGGEAMKTLSIELRQRLPAPEYELAAFYDVGNVTAEASDWASGDDLGSALGVGLRYLLPVGPLRLDVAWNPSAEEDEDEVVLHFALGIAF